MANPQHANMQPDGVQEICYTIEAYLRGGTPGKASLKRVLQSVFKTYGVKDTHTQRQILAHYGLKPCQIDGRVSFYLEYPSSNPLHESIE